MSLSWFTSSKNNFRSMSTTYFLPCLINSCAVRTAQCAIPSVRLRDRHPRTGPSLYSPLQTFFRAEFLAEPALAFATVAVTASGHFRFYFISDLFMPMLGRRGQASRLTQHTSTQPTPRRRDASATYTYAYASEIGMPALHITHPNLGAFLFVILVGVQDGCDPLHSGC